MKLEPQVLEVYYRALQNLKHKARQGEVHSPVHDIAYNWWHEAYLLGGPSFYLDSTAWHLIRDIGPRWSFYTGTPDYPVPGKNPKWTGVGKINRLMFMTYVLKILKDRRYRHRQRASP